MTEIADNEYKCGMCGEVFEKGWSDEEAIDEMGETFGSIPEDKRALVCDDCFRKLMGFGLEIS